MFVLFIVSVANPPEKSKDDSNLASRNGQLARKYYLHVYIISS